MANTNTSFPVVRRPNVDDLGELHAPAVATKVEMPEPKPSQDIPPIIADLRKRLSEGWKPPICPECGSRLDKKPVLCINRGHLMSYEKSRERARFRNAKSRRK